MMMYGYRRVTPAIKYLLIVNIVIALIQRLPTVGGLLTYFGALIPSQVFERGEIWRPFTYMFLHDARGIWHLLFNMFGLWMFGSELEEMWGTRRFLIFYLLAGVGSGLLSFFMWNNLIIGASGAIYGILFAYGYYFPDRQLLLFFAIPVPARMAAVVFFLISFLFFPGGGVAHLTHLGGIVIGFLYVRLYRPVSGFFRSIQRGFEDRQRRRKARESAKQERYYEEIIDPILKKISEKGMDSLTREEKAKLERASRSSPQRLKSRKIVPFEIFKNR